MEDVLRRLGHVGQVVQREPADAARLDIHQSQGHRQFVAIEVNPDLLGYLAREPVGWSLTPPQEAARQRPPTGVPLVDHQDPAVGRRRTTTAPTMYEGVPARTASRRIEEGSNRNVLIAVAHARKPRQARVGLEMPGGRDADVGCWRVCRRPCGKTGTYVTSGVVRLFLGGDVMTGRGIDQILPSPGDPRLWEHYLQDARTYVALAERVNGTIQRPVPVSWPWGDALAVLDGFSPDVRFVNLETSITQVAEPAPGKAASPRAAPATPLSRLSNRWSCPRRAGSGTADELAHRLRVGKRPGVQAVVSIHWGSNWGYQVPSEQVEFARRLIDGGVDIVHGHSSHHPRPVELYRGKLILYGRGDLIDDYEGISGYEDYRSDLRLLYLATLEATTGRLVALQLVPFQSRQMRLCRADHADTRWLRALMASISACDVRISDDDMLEVRCPN